MNEQPTPNFPGISQPTTDFLAIRSQLRTPPLFVDVDLTSARAISANSQQLLTISGNFIYCDPKLSSGVATGYFVGLDGKATPITLYPGAAFDVPFTSIVIENTAQPSAGLRLIYGTDIAFRPANAAGVSILNAISVIDAGYQRTTSRVAFQMGINVVAGGAGNCSQCQLYNPAASGVNVVVEQYSFTLGASGVVILARYDTAITVDAGSAINKMIDGTVTDSKARVRTSNNAAAAYGPYNFMGYWVDAPTRTLLETPKEPIVITPGTGVEFVVLNANIALYANWHWYEVTR